jgi:hypothetical protein
VSLETLIPAEIVCDELSEWLTKLAQRPDVRTILEIGSSSGEGSTQAIVNGMLEAEHEQELFTIEMSTVRHAACKDRYANLPWVHCFQGSAVLHSGYLTAEEVNSFYLTHETNLNKYPLEQVLGWLKQDLEAYAACPHTHVIQDIKLNHAPRTSVHGGEVIHFFDMVALDGSAFTGYAELSEVYGAKIIVLDDVYDIKHWSSFQSLCSSAEYELVEHNPTLRNGYAIFQKRT